MNLLKISALAFVLALGSNALAADEKEMTAEEKMKKEAEEKKDHKDGDKK